MSRPRTKELADVPYEKQLEAFRLHAFHIYYDHAFAEEKNMAIRFGKAIAASVQPIKNESLVREWWTRTMRTRDRKEWLELMFPKDPDDGRDDERGDVEILRSLRDQKRDFGDEP